jgi:hypothetical protein
MLLIGDAINFGAVVSALLSIVWLKELAVPRGSRCWRVWR